MKLAQKLQALKGVSNLTYKNLKRISPKSKRKISTAFNQYWKIKSLGFEFHKTKDKKKISILKGFYGGNYDTKLFKGGFFPNSIPNSKARLKWSGKKFKIIIPKSGDVPQRSIIPIDHVKMASWIKKYLKKPKFDADGVQIDGGQAYISSLLKGRPESALFAPVTRSTGPLTKYGYEQGTDYMPSLIAEWESEYSDASDWLDGIMELGGDYE